MGFRGGLKQGGGFWNNVDGTFISYEFTTTPPGEGGSKKKGKKDSEGDEWVYFVPSIHIDGQEEPTTQHLFMGSSERYTISDDGQSVEMADGSPVSIGANTPVGRFTGSLLDASPEFEENLPDIESGEALEFSALVNKRLRLKQEKDEAGTLKRGKRKVKGKDGKTVEYDRTNTIVIALYDGEAESKPAKAGKPAGKPAGKGKANPLQDKADEAVVDLCKAAVDKKNPQGTIPVSKLSVGVIRILSGDKDKDAVRKLVTSEDYLPGAEDRGVIVYSEDDETVSLPEEE